MSLPDKMIMKTDKFDSTSTATAFAIVLSICVALWLLAVPTTMSLVTFGASVVVMMGGAVVALTTWSNGRPTRSIAHVLNDAEAANRRE